MPPNSKTPTPSTETSIIVALMEQIEGLRSDFKATTETIVKKVEDQGKETATKIDGLRDDIADMKIRLARGSERMEAMRRDIDNGAKRCVDTHLPIPVSTALERKRPSEAETVKQSRKTEPWKVVVLTAALTGIGTTYGPVIFQKTIDSLATKPIATQNKL